MPWSPHGLFNPASSCGRLRLGHYSLEAEHHVQGVWKSHAVPCQAWKGLVGSLGCCSCKIWTVYRELDHRLLLHGSRTSWRFRIFLKAAIDIDPEIFKIPQVCQEGCFSGGVKPRLALQSALHLGPCRAMRYWTVEECLPRTGFEASLVKSY